MNYIFRYLDMKSRFCLFVFCFFAFWSGVQAQYTVRGKVVSNGAPVPFASIGILNSSKGTSANENGDFLLDNIPTKEVQLQVSAVGYSRKTIRVVFKTNAHYQKIELTEESSSLDEVVITGTLKAVSRMDSPVPVEVFSPSFFKKNPTPSLYDAMQNVNGVRPQLNCNVCNTGDIHINGLEGPYTMILIDGMPIVSGLSTVYGLSGIPSSLIARVEIVKGPASSLYGSEAVGGLINVITKAPTNAPVVSAEATLSSWNELNLDLGHKANIKDKASVLTGINYFNYNTPIDNNRDNFTDVTLQNRISVFQKWNFERKSNKLWTMAARYLYEDRWGGEMNWNKAERGKSNVYGESIYTNRWEVIGNYQLPVKEDLLFSFSYNEHEQDSYYGDLPYMAKQKIAFSQLTWDKKKGPFDWLFGAALRYTFYDDNSTATETKEGNQPQKTWLPGVFAQNEITFNPKHKLLLGLRYDYNSNHGNIVTPRLAYKWTLNQKNVIRLNAGRGFRVVNLFTEEHAALSGAREVEIIGALQPEQSYNLNLNYLKKVFWNNHLFTLDASLWHTYFNNQIIPDYETDPSKIIYKNLDGHAVSQGVSANLEFDFNNKLKVLAGFTLMDVYTTSRTTSGLEEKVRPMLTENFTATWALTYNFEGINMSLDYTGNVYSPMKLPVQTDKNDPRPNNSPWWSIQNIQLRWSKKDSNLELFAGVKNLLNYTPPANSISRSYDPFEKTYNPDDKDDLRFDPSYVYAPNQGIRGVVGCRFNVFK